jgi:hypothetical protein
MWRNYTVNVLSVTPDTHSDTSSRHHSASNTMGGGSTMVLGNLIYEGVKLGGGRKIDLVSICRKNITGAFVPSFPPPSPPSLLLHFLLI